MQKTIHIKDALRQGWDIVKDNFFLLAGIAFASFLVQVIPNLLMEAKTVGPIWIAAAILAGWVLGVLINIGFIHIGLLLVRGQSASWNNMFESSHVFIWYVVAGILYSLAVFGGLLLLVVPGIIFGIMFSLHSFIIVDKNAGPIEALKESARLTKGARLKLFGFWLLLGLINFAGALALGVGLLVTIPLTFLTAVVVYTQLANTTS